MQIKLVFLTRRVVKVRFQDPGVAGRYRSTFQALTVISRKEGFLALFRGITSPLVGTVYRD